jgi:hypothetical protein
MGDSLNVPIKVRTNELQQLQNTVEGLVDELLSHDIDDAEDLRSAYETHVDGVEAVYPEPAFANWVSMPASDWQLVVRHMGRLDSVRSWYLRTKLSSRLSDRLEELEGDDG